MSMTKRQASDVHVRYLFVGWPGGGADWAGVGEGHGKMMMKTAVDPACQITGQWRKTT
jgi:hypothetical protein